MIKWIQIKSIFRNKRFIFFTIIIPLIWFFSMKQINGKYSTNSINWIYIDGIICSMMGILGNSLVTFGKRIGLSRDYFILQSKISHYSIWKMMMDSLMIQLLLNFIITLLTLSFAAFSGAFNSLSNMLLITVIMQFIGIYVSIIGFSIGIGNSKTLLDSGGFPLMCIVAILITPFNQFANFTGINILTAIQKIFPGYYVITLANQINTSSVKINLVIELMISFIITSIPFCIFIWKKLGRTIKVKN